MDFSVDIVVFLFGYASFILLPIELDTKL